MVELFCPIARPLMLITSRDLSFLNDNDDVLLMKGVMQRKIEDFTKLVIRLSVERV